jgi:hypothetical protein
MKSDAVPLRQFLNEIGGNEKIFIFISNLNFFVKGLSPHFSLDELDLTGQFFSQI